MMRTIIIAGIALSAALLAITTSSSAINYSAGTYGSCTYDTCSIGLTSTPTVAVNVTPSGGGATCSVQSNSVTATTDSSTGYTVTVNNTDTNSILNGPNANTIASVGGTAASPVALTANTWGYRVDSVAGFGAGPTSVLSNGAIPVTTFAAIPSSASAGGVIKTTSSATGSGVAESVWYGVCVNTSKPSGSYSDAVIYTALIN
jgi:hypothetical protein